jgi:phosphatidate cytidylyltransferase
MLYQRILTAIPLALFVIWIIFFQPTSVFFWFLLFVVFISGFEWARLAGVLNVVYRVAFAVAITASVWAINEYALEHVTWLYYVAVMWWFSITLYLKIATPGAVSTKFKIDRLLIAFIILPSAALAMQDLHGMYVGNERQGPEWLFFGLSLVWVADIGAYFSGKKFGKNKLAPLISPGKTREGLFGALLATSVYALLASYYFRLQTEIAVLLVMLSIIVTFISVTGDLYISYLKREAGLKDSGKILPGHGGILDRIDSVLAAMPVFLLGLGWWIHTGIL